MKKNKTKQINIQCLTNLNWQDVEKGDKPGRELKSNAAGCQVNCGTWILIGEDSGSSLLLPSLPVKIQ